ncbi:hypothetical protein N7E81_08065 [Reichenbachiella carrageenanivorans]|uniref:Uncharacterized protein n=1 Tax=Reichenbachiella carrageenanivorans TaxID=2979869 RepID=A0ABY6D4M7_9BACT|nr:hypothetical protein [Reichenbachiella carrageenanivorans]UXX81053.1 hypothetical protein N7E81_08065 [Reichenbachiella carrageenanivorans]
MKWILAMLVFPMAAQAQWVSINPGAGGQVQDVVCAPSTPGTLYLASDMEGVYKTEDNGAHWHITGDLVHNRIFAVAVDPTSADQIYVGGMFALQVSTDGGKNYSVADKSLGESFGSVSVDPHDPNHIIAGIGWRDDYDFVTLTDNVRDGKGRLLESRDKGLTWNYITYDKAVGDKNVWTITFDPVKKGVVYLSAARGFYISRDDAKTWQLIKAPAKAFDNKGATVSPDGKVLYTAYATGNRASDVYASPSDDIEWIKVMEGLPNHKIGFWYPEVDTRSTSEQHKVLISIEGTREGLFEGTFTWENKELKNYHWDLIWEGTDGYDFGWDWADPNPRYVHYTPIGWKRAIWSTTNENMFAGIRQADGSYQWINKYSNRNEKFVVHQWNKDWYTYSGRGTESTYTYDIAADENYVIQGQGDNGLMESWDAGFSWSNIQHRTDSLNYSDIQAVAIGAANGKPVVLAQATTGYGGNARDGRLFVKKLETYSPTDRWEMIGGGPNHLLGLPEGIFRDVVVAPSNPEKVYLWSNDNGLYQIEDLGETLKQRENGVVVPAQKISDETLAGVITTKKIAVHPTNENIVFLASARGTKGAFRGEKEDGVWKWTKIYGGGSWEAEMVAWEHLGQTYLIYSGTSENTKKDGCNYKILLSMDEGKTWTSILDPSMALEMRAEYIQAWYPYIKKDYIFQNKGGLTAKGNTIIINFYNHKYQNGVGIFKGTLDEKGSVKWEDWTGDLHYPGVTSAIIASYEGEEWVYISTPGAGAWKRKL